MSSWNETPGKWKASVHTLVKKGVQHGTATTIYGRIQGTRRARVTEWSEKRREPCRQHQISLQLVAMEKLIAVASAAGL